MKRYKVPKYLHKRKIELSRLKILRRKYGYLFYRKTVCKILPSQARKFYNKKLLMKSFNQWFFNWYELTVGWKYLLRAEIHYNLNIQQKYLIQWRRYYANRKCLLVKKHIAAVHYEKVRNRFLIQLCFQKWKLYVKHQQEEKQLLSFAWNHFKSKSFPQFLQPYLNRWIALVKVAQREKKKIIKANIIYNANLLKKCLKVIFDFKNIQITKMKQIHLAREHYDNKLKFNTFKNWKIYLNNRNKTKEDMLLANAHYSCYLLKTCFKELYEHLLRARFVKTIFRKMDIYKTRKFFKKWIVYLETKHIKRVKYKQIEIFMVRKLKNKVFSAFKMYVVYKKNKKHNSNLKIVKCKLHLEFQKVKFSFIKWKAYSNNKAYNIVKKVQAFRLNYCRVLEKTIVSWKTFTHYKKNRKGLYYKAIRHYNISLVMTHFQKMRQNLRDYKEFTIKIEQAKKFYKDSLVQEAIQVIVLAGIKKKEQYLKQRAEKIYQELFIAQKYFTIWKRKTIYKKLMSKKENNNKEFVESKGNFCPNTEWLQMCFLVPQFFNDSLKF